MKFLVDMRCRRHSIALGPRTRRRSRLRPGSLDRPTDTEILTLARQDARTVVTADLDYPRLPALTGAEGPNLILFRGGDWSEPDVTARMQQILQVIGEGELTRSIVVVDRTRVRRRRLPII